MPRWCSSQFLLMWFKVVTINACLKEQESLWSSFLMSKRALRTGGSQEPQCTAFFIREKDSPPLKPEKMPKFLRFIKSVFAKIYSYQAHNMNCMCTDSHFVCLSKEWQAPGAIQKLVILPEPILHSFCSSDTCCSPQCFTGQPKYRWQKFVFKICTAPFLFFIQSREITTVNF